MQRKIHLLSLAISLEYASINSGYVVTKYGAQDGLLKLKEIEKIKKEQPEYCARIVD